MSISMTSFSQLDLWTSESTCCNGNTTFIEVVALAIWSVANGLKVDGKEQLSTCWVQIHGQSDTCRRWHKTVASAHQIIHLLHSSSRTTKFNVQCKMLLKTCCLLTAVKKYTEYFEVNRKTGRKEQCRMLLHRINCYSANEMTFSMLFQHPYNTIQHYINCKMSFVP